MYEWLPDLQKITRAHFCGNNEVWFFVCVDDARRLIDEIKRLRDENLSLKMTDTITQPCGHAVRYTVYRDAFDPKSERYCLFCENLRLMQLLRRLAPRPEIMSGWDDPDCDDDVAAAIAEACEVHGIAVPEWLAKRMNRTKE